MKILLDGYADSNFGDDLMLSLAAHSLKEHELYTRYDNLSIPDVSFTDKNSGFDAYLKVSGSGFLIHNTLGVAYRLREMRREKKYAPKRAVINCNISPFVNVAAELAIIKQLKSYELITVRDAYSLDYIRRCAPDAACEKYPDITLSLPDELIPSAACEGALGISVRRGADYAALAEIADRYTLETGKGVILLCFDAGIENDTEAAERVFSLVKFKNKTETAVYKNIGGMLYDMKRCSVILGIRLHSLLLSARMNIPFVPMAYSAKTINALREIGFNGEVYQAEAFDTAAVISNVLNATPPQIAPHVFKAANGHIRAFKSLV